MCLTRSDDKHKKRGSTRPRSPLRPPSLSLALVMPLTPRRALLQPQPPPFYSYIHISPQINPPLSLPQESPRDDAPSAPRRGSGVGPELEPEGAHDASTLAPRRGRAGGQAARPRPGYRCALRDASSGTSPGRSRSPSRATPGRSAPCSRPRNAPPPPPSGDAGDGAGGSAVSPVVLVLVLVLVLVSAAIHLRHLGLLREDDAQSPTHHH